MKNKVQSAPKSIEKEKYSRHIKKETEHLKTNIETDNSLNETRVDVEVQRTKDLITALGIKNNIPEDLLTGIDMDDPNVRQFLKESIGIDIDV